MTYSRIDTARTYETAIKIIPEVTVEHGIYFLQSTLARLIATLGEVSIVPIESGGHLLGEKLAETSRMQLNSMRMSHTEKGKYLPEAKHIYGPNMDQIIVQGKVLPVVLVDCVVESQASILGAVVHINKEVSERGHAPPLIHTLALISKISKDSQRQVPNLVYSFTVPTPIWVHGIGCDERDESDRLKPAIWGRLQDGFKGALPNPPYFVKSF